MQDGLFGSIPYHSRTSPAHYLTDGFAFFGRIAVGRTILASCLLLAISAMIQTATGKVCQMLVFIRHGILMKMMAAIKLNHLSHSLLLSFYLTHNIYSIGGIPSAFIALGNSISSSNFICSQSHVTKPSSLLVSCLHASDDAKGSCCCFIMPMMRS